MGGFFTAEEEGPLAAGCLARFDPRLKFVLLIALVVTVFSAARFERLALAGLPALFFLFWQPTLCKSLLRRIWYLRWLLVFTLLLHLFLTPGRTLFGSRFLSFDGLVRGLLVDFQLLLALFFTLVFALSTRPEAVAWASVRLLRPLEWLGLKVSAGGDMLLLVLHLLPRVFAQGGEFTRQMRAERWVMRSGRLRQMALHVSGLIGGLVEDADRTARDIVAGDGPINSEPDGYSWSQLDSVGLLVAALFLIFCWSI